MKKETKKVFAWFVIPVLAFGLLFAGCDNGNNGGGNWIDEINWNSHSGMNTGFFVDNHTSSRLVAFHGSVSQNNLLGGIPALADNHGIWRNPSLFDITRVIPVVIVREDDLRTHYGNNTLGDLNVNPLTRIM